jgi:hypothetical protein
MDKAGPESRHAQYVVGHPVLACDVTCTNEISKVLSQVNQIEIQTHRSALGKWANSMGSSLFMWGDFGRGVSLSIWSSSAFMPGLLWFNLYGRLLLLLLRPPTRNHPGKKSIIKRWETRNVKKTLLWGRWKCGDFGGRS